jgi:hypothetical protein
MELFLENSSDLEDLREDYKNELITLHATLKAFNRDLDFSDILKLLLVETGPAVAHVQKLAKQIACRNNIQRKTSQKCRLIFCVKAQHKPLAVQAVQQQQQKCRLIFCFNTLHKHLAVQAAHQQQENRRQIFCVKALHKLEHLAVQQQQQLWLQLLGRVQPAMGLHAAAAGGEHLHLPEALFQSKSHQLGGN